MDLTQLKQSSFSIQSSRGSIWKRGDPMIWLTGSALVICLFMVFAFVGIITTNSVAFFWPTDVTLYQLKDGGKHLAILRRKERIPPAQAREQKLETNPNRQLIMVGNRDFYSQDFIWINDLDILSESKPISAWVMERREYGKFIGFPKFLKLKDRRLEGIDIQSVFSDAIHQGRELFNRIYRIEKFDIGKINSLMEQVRLDRRRIERTKIGDERALELNRIEQRTVALQIQYQDLVTQVAKLREEAAKYRIGLEDITGTVHELPLSAIIEAWQPNAMSLWSKMKYWVRHVGSFILDDPREANTEGGIFPAIFGTAMMVILMSIAVVPFGVLTAFYLCEYAREGLWVRTVRIALNNLAGIPSIVYGVFGLGFFVYFIGGNIDRLFYPDSLPNPTWGSGGILWASLTLALLTIPVVVMATEESISAVPRSMREGSLALGASQFQTIKNILLPASLPGILTGVILAMARGAGEVAPLMITGVVKLAPSLPIDGIWPFFHLERKFMHLGFHIYDVGFQSPNVEASRPMVFASALLLILLVIALNLGAIILRDYVRRKYTAGAFN